MTDRKIKLPYVNPDNAIKSIGRFIVETILDASATGGVIGLSGGVDSTVTAAITKKAFDDYNKKNPEKDLELIGYMLPSLINTPKDTIDGINVAKKLNIIYHILNIDLLLGGYRRKLPEVMESNFHRGNLTSRLRANILLSKAGIKNKLVIGTGNKDEDFGVGYYTMYGDGASHLNPIGNLSKRIVKQLASYLGFDYIARKAPTAGLEPGQTDFKDLGYTYEVVELISEGICQGFSKQELCDHKKIKEIIEPWLLKSKFNSIDSIVNDVLRRHYTIVPFKEKRIHPPKAQVKFEYR